MTVLLPIILVQSFQSLSNYANFRPITYWRGETTLTLSKVNQNCNYPVNTLEETYMDQFIPLTENKSTKSTLSKEGGFVSDRVKKSPLNMICDEKQEFNLKVGKAIDTLKKDYPYILTESPDFSIFHDDVEVVDPSGVTIHGKKNYETSFRVVHSVVAFFYCPESSGLTFRIVYDMARANIRISWNAVVIPKSIYGGERNTLHVDGISVYEIDRASGWITKHKVEHLLVNNSPVHAPNGLVHALTGETHQGIPVAGGFGMTRSNSERFMLEFRKHNLFSRSESLFSTTSASASTSSPNDNFNYEEFEKKNLSRKKFGLPPLSEEEFERIEAEVRQLHSQQRQRQQQAKQAASVELAQEKEKKGGNFFANMMGDLISDTCESNSDCERPQLCCDLLFKKVCCANGMKVFNGMPGQMQPMLVPIRAQSDYPRRGGPDGMSDDFY